MKPGYQTSEFWVTILNKVFVFVITFFVLTMVAYERFSLEQAGVILPFVIAAIVGTSVGAGTFSISRGIAKTAPVTIEREVSILSQPDPVAVERREKKISALRAAAIEAEAEGIDVEAIINKPHVDGSGAGTPPVKPVE